MRYTDFRIFQVPEPAYKIWPFTVKVRAPHFSTPTHEKKGKQQVARRANTEKTIHQINPFVFCNAHFLVTMSTNSGLGKVAFVRSANVLQSVTLAAMD